VLTYDVVPESSGIKIISNSAGVGINSGGTVLYHKSSYSESLGGSVSLSKQYMGGLANDRPYWLSTITTPLPAGAKFIDYIYKDYLGWHRFTAEDIESIQVYLGFIQVCNIDILFQTD
jgi:hypothetical protein